MGQIISFRQDTDSVYRWETVLSICHSLWCSSRFCSWANFFILYTQPLSCVIGNHPVSHQMYANDTQIYSSSSPSEISATIHNMEKCICDVKSWMMCNKLQMNHDKTEAILIATQRTNMSHALPSSLHINGISTEFSKSLRGTYGLFLTSPFHYTSIS